MDDDDVCQHVPSIFEQPNQDRLPLSLHSLTNVFEAAPLGPCSILQGFLRPSPYRISVRHPALMACVSLREASRCTNTKTVIFSLQIAWLVINALGLHSTPKARQDDGLMNEAEALVSVTRSIHACR